MHNDFYIIISIMFDKFILTLRICVCACVCVFVFVRVFVCGRDIIWKGTLLCVDVMKFGRVHFVSHQIIANRCSHIFLFFQLCSPFLVFVYYAGYQSSTFITF